MKELSTRAISGAIYISLLILSIYWQYALVVLFFLFGLICMAEFKKLIQLESKAPYIVFTIMYLGFSIWALIPETDTGFNEAIQILQTITIFVQLFLIKDLFSEKTIPLFESKRFILTTFYLTSAFIFLIMIANNGKEFTPMLLLGCFVLIWVNDTGAYIVGKNFGKQKLFPSVSPKKTFEGFLGGLFFACLASYFISRLTGELDFTHWLILAIIASVFGTLGDLIESKFKRQAGVKDSGVIMPGHGGLLDRLDSIIFAAPFLYLFLRLFPYVS
ncbi:phosphatidate cytidylyltransferase [Gelidibacter salicanalis]|uniref:Phosphatidate cytidylyltransferase n=1 Tax=Gelidibacter salicanalis TaxID=291193 RepID=A0A934NKM0_9FLAO|nr:phosphatidate cytidylyltransferase [Gelidibacter salicanalis]MBJ7881297.1 phosphatidate cytidylyltransferase [Gelidibacter salicanalis]